MSAKLSNYFLLFITILFGFFVFMGSLRFLGVYEGLDNNEPNQIITGQKSTIASSYNF